MSKTFLYIAFRILQGSLQWIITLSDRKWI